MGSITTVKKPSKATGKDVISYRAFIRRTLDKGKQVSKSKVFETKAQAKEWLRNFESDESLAKLTQGHGKIFKAIVEDFIKAPPIKGTKYWPGRAPRVLDRRVRHDEDRRDHQGRNQCLHLNPPYQNQH